MLETFPVVVVAITCAVVRETWTAAGIAIAAIVIASGLAFHRLEMSVTRQRIITLLALCAGLVLAPLDPSSTALGRFSETTLRFGLAGLLAAAVRLSFANGEGQFRSTFVFSTMAMVACGQPARSLPYMIAVGIFVPTSALALSRRHTGPRLSFPETLRARAKGYAMLLVIAGASAAVVVFALVRAQSAIQRRFERYVSGQNSAAVGFSNELMLGSMTGMLMSDEVVMRIRGKPTDYLRGVVYDTYEGGEWLEGPGRVSTPIIGGPRAEASERSVAVYEGQLERAFLPLEACNIHTVGPSQIDQNGLVRPIVNRVLEGAEFRARCDERGLGSVRPPIDRERGLPPSMRKGLVEILAAWQIHGPQSDQLAEIEKHFRSRFHYSLTSEHHGGDPTMHFLRENNEGHCEFFASGMTLLARAAGIPARVVGGYRVNEPAPFGESYVVRDRDAHAWVEAYVDGAWRTYDPTPFVEGGDGTRNLGLVARAREYIRAALTELGAWFMERGGAKYVLGVVAFFGLGYAAYRFIPRRQAKGAATDPIAARFAELSKAIERLGEPRDPSETLDVFAARLRERKETWAMDAAELLDRYARFRYGGVGSEDELAAAVTSFAKSAAAT